MNATLTAVGMAAASFWSPSRGPTSTIVTRSGIGISVSLPGGVRRLELDERLAAANLVADRHEQPRHPAGRGRRRSHAPSSSPRAPAAGPLRRRGRPRRRGPARSGRASAPRAHPARPPRARAPPATAGPARRETVATPAPGHGVHDAATDRRPDEGRLAVRRARPTPAPSPTNERDIECRAVDPYDDARPGARPVRRPPRPAHRRRSSASSPRSRPIRHGRPDVHGPPPGDWHRASAGRGGRGNDTRLHGPQPARRSRAPRGTPCAGRPPRTPAPRGPPRAGPRSTRHPRAAARRARRRSRASAAARSAPCAMTFATSES